MPNALPPVDNTVVLPPSVAAAAAAADALHKSAYNTPEPEPAAQETPPAEPATPAQEQAPAPQEQAPAPQEQAPAPADQEFTAPASRDDIQNNDWASRYNSMRGRWERSQTTIGQLQEQMSEMGEELLRTQQALQLARSGQAQAPQTLQHPPAQPLLTDQDREQFGPELIDFVQRAAREAISPDLQRVDTQVRQVSQRTQINAQQKMYEALDDELPEWRALNRDSRFKQWLHLRDIYSGEVRGKLLNAAVHAADAPRALAFFRSFLNEEQATGHAPSPPSQPQPPAPVREPATTLQALAAPGRAKPASGENPGSAADKPVYTRAQIRGFYRAVSSGAYVGRDADKVRDEQAIFVAQREGRVR